jgi:hypothetical protein
MPTNMPRVENGYALHDHEIAARAAPGGRLPIRSAGKADPRGEPGHTVISDGSPAAIAAAQERYDVKHKPDLVAKRQRGR